jgi:hypothetical protein
MAQIINFSDLKENLNNDKVYFRQLQYNDIPMRHKEGLCSDKDEGYYIEGIEFFKHGKFYILKSYTIWAGKVCLNSVSKINENGKLTIFKINYFGITNGECRMPRGGIDKESYSYTNEYIGAIREWLNHEDEKRKVIIKDKQIKL